MSAADRVIRVVLADDQTVVREGLSLLLGLMAGVELVAAVEDGEQAVAAVAATVPDVALLDLRMPRLDGAAATRRIRAEHPEVQVVVLTTYADDASVLDALSAGACCYLTKDAGADEIEAAVRAAADGRTRLDPAVQRRLVELVTARGDSTAAVGAPVPGDGTLDAGLTERETEVLRLMADGLTNRAIASQLFVTEATVKTHVNNLFAKLAVGDRAAAVAWAYRTGVARSATSP